MSDIRLVCLTLEYPPDKGGVASYLHGLSSNLNAKTGVIRAKMWSYWPRWWPMLKQCRDSRADALLISHLLPVGTAAWLARVWGGPAYILVVHGMDVLLASRSAWKRWLAKNIIKGAYLVIANSEYTANLTRERFQRDALVLTPGYTPHALPSRAEARAQLGLNPDEKIILSVGRLVSRKGFDTLIESCRNLSATLVIVGNGPDHVRLEHIAKDAKNIRLITSASDAKRDAWYAAADVFSLLVREEKNDVEGFGIVYLEAAAAGLPIVAGKSGGVSEAVQDGVTGMLVDPHSTTAARQALSTILENPKKAREMGVVGQKRVHEHFEWKARADALKQHLPLISIIIPVFNRREAFRRCLASVAKQTYRHLEVIIIDDGSSEAIEPIANEYASQLNIRYIRQENQGPPRARNRGFKESTGEHILFLDADAALFPDAVENMTRAMMEDTKADVVYGNHFFGWKLFRGRSFDASALRQGSFIHTSSLIRREAFPGFDPSLRRFQDWDVWLTMCRRGSKFVWIPHLLFRIESGGTMSKWLPAFVHRMPWTRLGWTPSALKSYRDAEQIVKTKHLIP